MLLYSQWRFRKILPQAPIFNNEIKLFYENLELEVKFKYFLTNKGQSCRSIETTQLIFTANQLAGFYTIGTLTFNPFLTNVLIL